MKLANRKVDVIVVGGSLAGAACAKRLVDAGFETVVFEREKLPRHKICSGILSPRGHRFLLENFGPLPPKILHEPTSCRGVTFHFPSMLSLSMDFDHGPTPHLHRKYSDYWALEQSGAELQDEVKFLSLEENGDWTRVRAQSSDGPFSCDARWVVGADGPSSTVIRSLYPEYHRQIPWFLVGQKLHDIIECPLDPDYFHFWFHPKLGHYTWSHARDGRQIVGVGFERGGNFNDAQQKVVSYLEKKHGVRLKTPVISEATPANFGLSLINRYVFGKGDVLITGQAAGFLNMMAEGMSCALHSGAISGEAIVKAAQTGQPVQSIYRKMIASEVRRCSDQWNPLLIAFSRPHEADFRRELRKLPFREQKKIIREIFGFIRIYAKFRWGRQILRQALERALKKSYASDRWL